MGMAATGSVQKNDIGNSSIHEPEEKIMEQEMPAKQPVMKKVKSSHGKNGIFTPAVKGLRLVIGDEKLNKVRAKAITMHSDVIKNFVKTSDSSFGQNVLKQLFVIADKDHNGTIEEAELQKALETLGFDFLREKLIKGIFERADRNKDGHIDLKEFIEAAPRTLQTNLVKLAKNNGGNLGFLS